MPFCPQNNNPWLYMAYVDMILRFNKEELNRGDIVSTFLDCCIDQNRPGLFNRWPDGTGGLNSHDEIMGAAYLHEDIARWLLRYLDDNDGEFNNTKETSTKLFRFNVYRMVFLRPYVKARAGLGMGPLAQTIWSGHIILSAMKDYGPDRAGARLRSWMMFHGLKKYWICQLAMRFWVMRMNSKGESLAGTLMIEPKENPILAELAPQAGWVILDE